MQKIRTQNSNALDNTEEQLEFSPDVNVIGGNSILSYGYQDPSFNVDVQVRLQQKGFVAIYKINSDSEELAGSSEIIKEGKSDLTIKPIIPLNYGDTINIFLYLDNGDGEFDPVKDKLAKDTQNKVITKSIQIQKVED